MNKSKLVSILGIGMITAVSLTGCGTVKNEKQNIAKREIAEQNNMTEEEISKIEEQISVPSNNTSNAEIEELALAYEGTNIIPGVLFDEHSIAEEAKVSEIPSCAFDGNDTVYTFENVEITVAKIEGEDRIYSVYFLNDGVETTEGVKISDTKQDMINAYGENFVQSLDTKYTYTIGDIELSFIIENDVITSIEYTLRTN